MLCCLSAKQRAAEGREEADSPLIDRCGPQSDNERPRVGECALALADSRCSCHSGCPHSGGSQSQILFVVQHNFVASSSRAADKLKPSSGSSVGSRNMFPKRIARGEGGTVFGIRAKIHFAFFTLLLLHNSLKCLPHPTAAAAVTDRDAEIQIQMQLHMQLQIQILIQLQLQH